MVKFVKLPVSELSFTKEQKREFLDKVTGKKEKDGIDWEALGIVNPNLEEDSEYIEVDESSFKTNWRRVNINLIEDYGDTEIVRDGKPCSLLTYLGVTCTVLLTADQIDQLLKSI